MKLFGLRIMKDNTYQQNKKAYTELYIDHMTSDSELYNQAFKDGVQHVFNTIQKAIETKNLNKVLSISGATTEQLKLLVNAMMGKFTKKASNV